MEGIREMRAILLLFLLILVNGCVTTNRSFQTENTDSEDILYLKEQVALLKNKVEIMEANYAQLLQETKRSKEGDSSIAALKLRLDELERKLAALDSVRIKEHQALVEQINSKLATMANILQQSSSSGGISSQKASAASRTSTATKQPKAESNASQKESQEGYEHIVQPGETLSAIAAAYKVSVKAIIEANNISKPESLRAGQKLFIPK